MTTATVTYVPGELNVDYIVVRNAETMPKGARHTPWGTFFPGQGADGYGRKISTDLMLQFKGEKRKYRVYCVCFSNAGSHYIIRNKKSLYLGTVFQEEIKDKFYD